jgi:hypothetical protein
MFLIFGLAIAACVLFLVSVRFDPTEPPPPLKSMRFSLGRLLMAITVFSVLLGLAAVLTNA